MIRKLITRKRELPLCWHFALTVIGTGIWALIIAFPTLTDGTWLSIKF